MVRWRVKTCFQVSIIQYTYRELSRLSSWQARLAILRSLVSSPTPTTGWDLFLIVTRSPCEHLSYCVRSRKGDSPWMTSSLWRLRRPSSLRVSYPGPSGGGATKERRACNHVSGIWIPPQICGSPSTELSDFRQSARSGNEREWNKLWKASAKGNDVITNVISADQHFASTFSMQIFKFPRRTWKLSFLFPPNRESAPESLLADLRPNFWTSQFFIDKPMSKLSPLS